MPREGNIGQVLVERSAGQYETSIYSTALGAVNANCEAVVNGQKFLWGECHFSAVSNFIRGKPDSKLLFANHIYRAKHAVTNAKRGVIAGE